MPLYKKKITSSTKENKYSKDNFISRKKFKTPLLTKQNIFLFTKEYDAQKDTTSISPTKPEKLSKMASEPDENAKLKTVLLGEDSILNENVSKSKIVAPQNKISKKDTNKIKQKKKDKSSKKDTNKTNQKKKNISDNLHQSNTSFESLSQKSMNEPDTKKAYLDFIKEKRPDENSELLSPISLSQNLSNVKDVKKKETVLDLSPNLTSSQSSMNDPVIKDAYLSYVSSINKGHSESIKAPKKNKLKKDTLKCDKAVQEKSSKKQQTVPNSSVEKGKKKKSNITESKDSQKSFNSSKIKKAYPNCLGKNQKNSNEPPSNISHKEKMMWLQEQRNVPVRVFCDSCDKLRTLNGCMDPTELPKKWFCFMNPDPHYNKCSDPEEELSPQEAADLISNKYNSGSLVWAKMDGYPWWPAMVDDDPDTETYYWLDDFSDSPTWYNVTFFDTRDVTRAWIRTKNLEAYMSNMKNPKFLPYKFHKLNARVQDSMKQAKQASELQLLDRLRKYSFISRYKKPVRKPRDNTNWPQVKVLSNKKKQLKKKNMEIGKKRVYNRILSSSSNSFEDMTKSLSPSISEINRTLSQDLFDLLDGSLPN